MRKMQLQPSHIYANIRFISNWKVTTLTKRRQLEKWVHLLEPDGWKPICILTPWLCTQILPPVHRRVLAADRLRLVDAAKHRRRQPKMPTGPIYLFFLFWCGFSKRVGWKEEVIRLSIYRCGHRRCYRQFCQKKYFFSKNNQTIVFNNFKLFFFLYRKTHEKSVERAINIGIFVM